MRHLASVDHFSEMADISPRFTWRLIHERKLPVLRIGRRTLVPVERGIKALEQLGASGRKSK